MSRSARSLNAFAAYLLVLGPVLMIAPNLLLGLFGIPDTQEVWIRVVGMMALILAYYYFVAAKAESKPLFKASVVGRGSVILFFAAFVLLASAPPQLLLFGLVDLAAAIWTALCLRAEGTS